jgi:hypothetical protein
MNERKHKRARILAAAAAAYLAVACIASVQSDSSQHLWWEGLGPVLPHDSFPSDCSLCHEGEGWQGLRADFEFDHEAETGVALDGAHEQAMCLRCHNDRGPVETFSAQGCAGCHEDIHLGTLSGSCTDCHQQDTWRPVGQVQLHNHTRFPLVGVHASTSCRRCHPGAEVGIFQPADVQCITCHQSDLARAINPNHVGLGWVDRCDRCHQPTTWNQAESNP